MVSRFTLVPSAVFSEDTARQMLSKVVLLSQEEPLSFAQVPIFDAVMVYAGERPAVYDLLMSTFKISDYNKIVAKLENGILSLVVAQGKQLLLCNAFQAPDYTTAQYYIFMVLKKLQINPEISTLFFANSLPPEAAMSLLTYFKNVDILK